VKTGPPAHTTFIIDQSSREVLALIQGKMRNGAPEPRKTCTRPLLKLRRHPSICLLRMSCRWKHQRSSSICLDRKLGMSRRPQSLTPCLLDTGCKRLASLLRSRWSTCPQYIPGRQHRKKPHWSQNRFPLCSRGSRGCYLQQPPRTFLRNTTKSDFAQVDPGQ
jgi:hypothetical protein